jgi:hypothetical protein
MKMMMKMMMMRVKKMSQKPKFQKLNLFKLLQQLLNL